MDTKFTPGPWTTRLGDSVVNIVADNQNIAVTNRAAYWQHFDETDLANARLIAAAPDMYEALTIALIALDLDPENHPPQWSGEEAGEKIRAALERSKP